MKIYIARHGQTDWNKEMRAQGRKDLSLNPEGGHVLTKTKIHITI